MKKLVITKGLPASGKTTWSKQQVKDNPAYVRVNRDDIRHMLGEYWMPSRERLVTSIERDSVESALGRGYSVIVDATNLRGEAGWTALAQRNDAVIEIKDFTHVPFETCIERDQQRENPVGKEVIERMYNKYLNESNTTV